MELTAEPDCRVFSVGPSGGVYVGLRLTYPPCVIELTIPCFTQLLETAVTCYTLCCLLQNSTTTICAKALTI